MKLTNHHREAFLNAAMNEVPQIDYEEKIYQAALADAVAALPPAVRKLWDNKETRGWVQTPQKYHNDSVGYLRLPALQPGHTFSADVLAVLRDLAAKKREQLTARESLRSKLKAAAYGVTTRKALADLLPEFAKYLPQEDAPLSRMVPAVANLVTDFMQAGWPKGQKPPVAAKKGRKA